MSTVAAALRRCLTVGVVVGYGGFAATVALSAPAPARASLPAASTPPVPDSADALNQVQALATAGRADAALHRADALIALHPDDARLLFEKGLLLARLQRTREAIAVYERMAQRFPDLPEPLNNLAVLYARSGDLDRARQSLEASVQRQDSMRIAHANLSDVNLRLAGRAYAHALQVDAGPSTATLTLIDHVAGVAASTQTVAAATSVRAASPSTATSTTVATARPLSGAPTVVLRASEPASGATDMSAAVRSSVAPLAPLVRPGATTAAARPSSPSAVAAPAVGRSTAADAASSGARASASAPTLSSRPPAALSSASTASAAERAGAVHGSTDIADEAAVRSAVTAWAAAWSQKNLAAYFAAYVPGYKGSDGSAAAWQAARRVRILGKSRISVSLGRVAIELTHEGVAKASFRQSYAADQLSVSSAKTLDLVKLEGKWLIRKEVAGS